MYKELLKRAEKPFDCSDVKHPTIGVTFLLIVKERLKLRHYRVIRSLWLPFIITCDMLSSLGNHFIHKLVVIRTENTDWKTSGSRSFVIAHKRDHLHASPFLLRFPSCVLVYSAVKRK